jgi:hypothetical protein
MSNKLLEALRKKYASPQAALRALGLDAALIEGPRLACDASDAPVRFLARALRSASGRAKLATDAKGSSYADRWPDAARIKEV